MINRIAHGIREEVRELTVAKASLAWWAERGLSDYSCTIHSTGITYWNLIGRALGFVSIGEFPAPQDGPYAFVGGDVRSDSVWFDSISFSPVTLVEFERYSNASDEVKLIGKVENLLLGYHRWQQKPSALVLAYWTKGHLTLPQHEKLRKRIRSGFETTAKERVRGATACDVFFIQTILTETELTGDLHAFLMMISAASKDGRFFDCKRDFQSHPEILQQPSMVRQDLRELALKCFLETRDIDSASALLDEIVADEGENPNILLQKASILGLQAKYEESSQILLQLNRDFPGRPAILKRLITVFEQLRDIGKASAFLKAYEKIVTIDTWAQKKREQFVAIGYH